MAKVLSYRRRNDDAHGLLLGGMYLYHWVNDDGSNSPIDINAERHYDVVMRWGSAANAAAYGYYY